MADADPRLIRLVQQVDEERQRRLRAEMVARALQATNAKLRRQLHGLTQDQALAELSCRPDR